MEFTYNVCLNTGRSIRVVNKGAGGLPAATARGQFENAVLPEKPDIVIMQFGLNDQRHDGSRGPLPISTPEEFGEHLSAMIAMCRERAGARVIVFGNHQTRALLTMPTGLSYDETRARYNAIARRAAEKGGARFADVPAILAAAGLRPGDVVADDGVHLSPCGLSAYAQVAANEVRAGVNEIAGPREG
jgi:lysophospholipase L1-like esterase